MEGYTKIGRIRPNYTGAWNAETAYTVLEMVKNEAGTASYIAKQDVPAGTPLTDETYWAMVLDAGDVIDAAERAAADANKAAQEYSDLDGRIDQLSEEIDNVIEKQTITSDGETTLFAVDGPLTFDDGGYSQEISVVGAVEHTMSFEKAVYDGDSAACTINVYQYDTSGAQIAVAEAVPFVRVAYEQMGTTPYLKTVFFPNGGWAKFTPEETAQTIKIRAFVNGVGTALTERVPEDWTLTCAQSIGYEYNIKPEKIPEPSLLYPGSAIVSSNLFDISAASTQTDVYLGKDTDGNSMFGWYLTGAGTATSVASGTGVDSISALIPMTAGQAYVKPIGTIICFFDADDRLTGSVIGMADSVFVVPNGCVAARMSFKSAETATMRLFEGDEFKPYDPYRIGYQNVSVPEAPALREMISRNALIDMGEHMRDVADEANQYTAPDRHTFAFISDTHITQLTRYVMSLVANMSKHVACSYIAHGGDIIDGMTEPANELRILSDLARCANDSLAPVLYVKGNHDANRLYANQNGNDADDYILNAQLYVRTNRFRKDAVVAGDAKNLYFYRDDEETKIRTVFLNTFNAIEDEVDGKRPAMESASIRLGEAQTKWLADVALNLMDKGEDKANWSVITVSHRPLIGKYAKLVEAFRNGSDTSIVIGDGDITFTISTSFSTQGAGKFVAMFVGDDHYDAIEIFEDAAGVYPVIHILNASMARDNVNLPTATNGILMPPVKTFGTETETAFDIVTIDKTNHHIYLTRYGAVSYVYNTVTEEFDIPAARTRIIDYSTSTYVKLTD